MADIIVRLGNFESVEAAEKTAETIRASGGVRYRGDLGAEVNATITDVTVEDSPEKPEG